MSSKQVFALSSQCTTINSNDAETKGVGADVMDHTKHGVFVDKSEPYGKRVNSHEVNSLACLLAHFYACVFACSLARAPTHMSRAHG